MKLSTINTLVAVLSHAMLYGAQIVILYLETCSKLKISLQKQIKEVITISKMYTFINYR